MTKLNKSKQLRFLAVIPARYDSTRFPGKPLALLGGRPIIERVYERVAKVFPDVCVATDDERIYTCVAGFGGKAVMTSKYHKSGTDRCFEVVQKLQQTYDIIVNVQGDEPFVDPSQLQSVQSCFEDPSTQIATLVKPFDSSAAWEDLSNPNSPKVLVDNNGYAIYFSRSVIPYLRGIDFVDWTKHHTFYKHIGLYAYRAEVLRQITSLPQGNLEKCESLEQLRWLENGFKIKVGTTHLETIGIDTLEDLQKAEEFLNNFNTI